ncbi:hypothetical protein PRIPAC_93962 [Pristionchus pacificus]|uniref:Uncharacterized protein n=1 Tax=Pristionchus pacificus TaxID=54126 RepID=A0A2A6CDP6_PRIPA|nr:hypothetical protein PRIPAC_93962 [Pristionchus pacificus]|eukprot:PDM76237.1 hypothetical protein PRIPAC_39841 [Pristionchus pacificus]
MKPVTSWGILEWPSFTGMSVAEKSAKRTTKNCKVFHGAIFDSLVEDPLHSVLLTALVVANILGSGRLLAHVC